MAEEHEDAKLHFLDYWRVIRSRKEVILAVVLLVTLTGIAYTLALPKTYRASSRIEVREDMPDMPIFGDERIGMNFNPIFLRTQYQKIQSRPVIYEVVKALGLQQKWGEKLNNGQPLTMEDAGLILSKCLRVDQFRDTTLIDIQAFREDPDEARDIANQVALIYRDQRLSNERSKNNRAMESLDNELKKQQEKVEASDAEVERIRKDSKISVMGKGVLISRNLLQDLEAQRITSRIDMLTRKTRWDQVENLQGDDLIYQTQYIVVDQALQSLRKQLMDDEVQLKQLMQNYGENHPEVKQMRAAVDELRTKLSSALDGVKKGMKADYEVSKTKYDTIDREFQEAKELDRQSTTDELRPLEKAERDAQEQRDMLAALRARVTQRNIEREAPRTPVEIIEVAERPTRPVSPNIMLNILLSLFLGIGAGVGLAYFIEYLDTSVKTVDDVERYLGLPVLGVIPQKVRPLSEQGADSPHAEAYRVLRTNMQFANKGLQGGAFSVVSGGVGEGKSTTLFNLAYVCAQLGDKVLVVDSDLRRPVQHTYLGMSNRFGLTNVLMRDVPIEETIKATSIPNLHFLPSGKLPRSSLGLLDSQRMRELVKNLKARYDYVFFDSPPIVGVSDASILASEVDGVLLVVQYRKYPRSISLRAKRMLENVGTNIVGVVLNNINILRDDYYYYYHSYYSHYDRSDEAKPGSESDGEGKEKKEEVF
jgi:capsular exopolysaccharide synthesis family protein